MAREIGAVVGAVIGFYFGGPQGAALGAQIGGYAGGVIDPPDPIQGPRLTDLQVIASTYGTPIALIYGPENRIAGNVIWSTGLIETQSEESSGGKGGGGQTVQSFSYRMSLAISLGRGEIQGIKRISANSKLLFDIDELLTPPPAPTADVGMVVVANADASTVPDPGYGTQDGGPYGLIRFYQGTSTQQVDPTMEAHEGMGNVPAYRHTSYLVIQDLQLADYGNAMPNIEVEVVAQESTSVGTVVRDICQRAGITDVSTSSLSMPLRGFTVAAPGPAYNAIRPLTRAYFFDVAEQGGQIRCIRRGGGMRGVVPTADMGAREASANERIEPIRYNTLTDMRMPQEVVVNYADPEMDYQVNSQRSSRAAGNSENNLQVELPLVLSADEARQIADRELWEAWAARRSARFPVSDRWVGLNPADIVGTMVDDEIIAHRLTRINRGHDGVIEIEAVYEDPEAYLSTAVGAPPNIPDNPIRLPGPTFWQPMDTPILREQDDDAGFYWVAAGQPGWRGAQIERSSDLGDTFQLMSPIGVSATIGNVPTPLATGPADIWDRGTVLTVELMREDFQLVSLPELAVLNGGNAAWVGPPDGHAGEIIQFTTATLVGPGVYELSNLLRGRLGTEHTIHLHGMGERFILLNPTTLGRSDYGAGDWNFARDYRAVSNFTNPSDAPIQLFTNTGVGKLPYSPVHIAGTRDGSNNLTITWIRRTRLPVPGLGRGPAPLGEETELYEVRIMSGVTTLRTITNVTTNSLVYTAAQQIEDGITPGELVPVRVFQVSGSRGIGLTSVITTV